MMCRILRSYRFDNPSVPYLPMIELNKHKDGVFVLPAVVDFINYETTAVIDVVQLKDDIYKKDSLLLYLSHTLCVVKKLKSCLVQTELKIENRKKVLKVRYYCNKIISNENQPARLAQT